MFFTVDKIETIRTIKTYIDRQIYLSDEFYTGINLAIELPDLDIDMFGCWNNGCIPDDLKHSHAGSLHQRFLIKLLDKYNSRNNRDVQNKIRFLFGDNMYFEKHEKEQLKALYKENKELQKHLISARLTNENIEPYKVIKDKYMSMSNKLINDGFSCFNNDKPSFMALGNHDIEPLFVLHQQIKKCYENILITENTVKFNSNWILPNAFYSVEFILPNSIKLLFIILDMNLIDMEYDSNIFGDETIKKIDQYRTNMFEWLNELLPRKPEHIKFVIGHTPLFYYAHKKNKEKSKEKSANQFVMKAQQYTETEAAPATSATLAAPATSATSAAPAAPATSAVELYKILIKHKVKFYMCADEHNLQYLIDKKHNIHHLICGASPGGGGGDETNTFNNEDLMFSGEIPIVNDIDNQFYKKIILNAPSFMKLNVHKNLIQINLIGPSNLSQYSKKICLQRELCTPVDNIEPEPEIYDIITVPKYTEYVSIYNCDGFCNPA